MKQAKHIAKNKLSECLLNKKAIIALQNVY